MPDPATIDAHAIVQAGGKGTRLRPATSEIPKPMLDVAGMPMIERLVRRLVDQGVRRVTVVVGHKGTAVREHLTGIDLGPGVELDFFEEAPSSPLGNAGAIGRVPIERQVGLMAFGDLVTDLDFAELLDRHRACSADVLLASHWEEHRLQLGELVTEGRAVRGYNEKPLKRFLICSGILAFRPEAARVIPTDGSPFGLRDWIVAALGGGLSVEHWEHGAFWMDVNSPELLAEADRRMAEIDRRR